MVNTAPAVLLPLLPVLWVISASVLWWRKLSRPWLFSVVAVFALLGIQLLISLVWNIWPIIGAHTVGISKVSPEEIQKYYEEKNRAAIIQAVLVFLAAVPFLWWLRGGLSARSV
jgi:hypothetical protein